MNSRERKELRYLRRKAKREDKIKRRSDLFADINRCFSFSIVMKYSFKCCNGVGWKRSTQLFKLHLFTIISSTCYNIKNNKYKVLDTYQFVINERGKLRVIDAPHIKDRLVHKVISNEVLLPIYEPHLIYDNGASQAGKGFTFAMNRVKEKLLYNYKKYSSGCVVLIDYSKFFENCSHEVIHMIHKKYIRNDYIIKVIEDYLFIGKGIALGVEIAQRESSIIPNVLDHYVQNSGCSIVRYMDDTVFFVNNYNDAKSVLEGYNYLSNKYGIIINKKKTKIFKINECFKYCKWIYNIDKNNRIYIIPDKNTIYRQRRKLNRMIKNKTDSYEIETVKNCFCAYLNNGDGFKYINYLNKKYLLNY